MQERKKVQGQERDSIVEIVYYTDPLCCWSWGLEPHWQKLKDRLGPILQWRYCMAGLIPDGNVFNDTVQSVSRPAQMGPVWMEASHLTGMPIRSDIWRTDPPSSSYLACIAVKCAEFQSKKAGEIYLGAIRKAVMAEGRNIAFQSTLSEIAIEIADEYPGLIDIAQFNDDLVSKEGKDAFVADLQEVQRLAITRLPTLIFRKPGRPSLITSGYKPYESLVGIVEELVPELK